MADLNGKTALVTGASRGIGRAIAQRLAADGAEVAVHYGRNDAAAKEVVAALDRAVSIRAELGVDGDVETLFSGVDEWLGGRRLDILVNNAGILGGTPLGQVTGEEFDRDYAVNARAPFFITQRAIPLLPDGGRIVNVSTAVTRIAGPFVHYAMSKGAIEVLTRTLAQALGRRRITVNAVSPGVVETDMGAWVHSSAELEATVVSTIALGRLGQPADVADVVAFLASEDARWVTGAVIDTSGGQWLGPNMG